MSKPRSLSKSSGVLVAFAGVALLPSAASATTAPWDAPLQTIQGWFTGPTAAVLAVIAIAIALYGTFFSEGNQGWKNVGRIGFAVVILGFIVTVVDQLFTGTGALMH